jgi:hypothetical protein
VSLGNVGQIEFTIESPEMPEVRVGETPPIIHPVYVTYQNALGHHLTMRQK